MTTYGEKIDASVDDVNEIDISEFKLNPDFYIHESIKVCNESLKMSAQDDGFTYIIAVSQLQAHAEACKYVDEKEIKIYLESKEIKDDIAKAKVGQLRESIIRYKYIVSKIFKNKTIDTPMRTKKKDFIEDLNSDKTQD